MLCLACARYERTRRNRGSAAVSLGRCPDAAVANYIAGVLAPAMVDALMPIAPRLKMGIHAGRICVYQGACLNGVFHEGLDRFLLHIGQQMDHDLPPTLEHPKDRRFFFLHRAAAGCAFAATTTAFSSLALDDLWLSSMAGHHIGFIALDLVG